MKRDLDLIRKILLEIETQCDAPGKRISKLPEYSEYEFAYHLNLLCEAGLITGARAKLSGRHYPLVTPTGLTWAGHDFLDACRDEGIWTKAKEKLKDIGDSATFEVIKTVLTQLALKQLGM